MNIYRLILGSASGKIDFFDEDDILNFAQVNKEWNVVIKRELKLTLLKIPKRELN